jgi:hypothetical protein
MKLIEEDDCALGGREPREGILIERPRENTALIGEDY